MKCTKCGKTIKETDKFCQYCGTEVKAAEKKTTAKKEVKAVEKKEEVKVVPVKKEAETKTGNGLAIAGMVLGIIGLVLSFAIGPFAFLLTLLGLILSICSKKSGYKIAGIVTSAIGIFIQIIWIVIALAFTSFFTEVIRSLDYDYDFDYDNDNYGISYKYASPYGEWKCKPYPSSDYTNKDETTLNLKYDGTFIYGPSDDLTNNFYSGTWTYEKEYDKNKEYTDREFVDIKAPVTRFKLDGVEQTTSSNMNLNMEMEFINDYDEALIIFYNTYNTYKCEK